MSKYSCQCFSHGYVFGKRGDNILKDTVGFPEMIFKSSITFKYVDLFSMGFAPATCGPRVGCVSSSPFVIIIYFIELVPYLSTVKK